MGERPASVAATVSGGTVQGRCRDFTMDYARFPRTMPGSRLFTTIAWRLGHVIAGVLAARNTALRRAGHVVRDL